MRNFLLDYFGFTSVLELLEATIGYKHHISTLWVCGAMVGAGVAGVKSWVGVYVYDPALGMLVLWACSALDIILGVSVSIENKQGVDPGKLMRAALRVVVQTLIVTLFYNMCLAWPFFIYHWMVDGLLALFTLSVFYSVIQNAHKLGFITDEVYAQIHAIVNIKRLVERLKQKNPSSN